MTKSESKGSDNELVAGLTTRISLSASACSSFHSSLTKLLLAGSDFSGFVNAELTPVSTSRSSEWIVIHRFRTEEQALAWCNSDARRQILDDELPPEKTVKEEVTPHMVGGGVAASITSVIHPGKEDEYKKWLHAIQTAESEFPGFEGTYVQIPTKGTPGLWLTLLKFKTPEHLDNWLNSDRRRELLSQREQLVATEDIKRVTSAFPGWFPTNPKTSKPPANYKGAMIVLMAIYPIVMVQSKFVGPALAPFINVGLSIFIQNAIGVSLLTWVAMPILNKIFYKWMFPDEKEKAGIEITGAALIAAIYAIELIVLWNLL